MKVHWLPRVTAITTRCGHRIDVNPAKSVRGFAVFRKQYLNHCRDVRLVTCKTCRRQWIGDTERQMLKGAA